MVSQCALNMDAEYVRMYTSVRERVCASFLYYNFFFTVNTHMHADHVTGTGKLKKLIPGCKSLISKASGAKADIHVEETDVIEFGRHKLSIRSTPGHTSGE